MAASKKPVAQSATRPRAAQPAGEVRIIGGQWKRSKLPVADKPGLRPTPDRVRETLFNWLGQDLTGWRCVDACRHRRPGLRGCLAITDCP